MSSEDSKTPSSEKEVPLAIEVKRDTLRKVHVELQDLPEAVFIDSVSEDVVKAVEPAVSKAREPEPEFAKASDKIDLRESKPKAPALKQPDKVKEGSSINRKALESTNRGKSPNSRRFVKGILHPSPFKVFFAALFAIASRLAFIPFVAIGLLVLFEKLGAVYLWGVLLFPLFAFLNVVTSYQVRCRVCGMKEFVPSKAHKHRDSHSFMYTGPIISTALHVILFKWFRCMFCGTPIRTKK